MIVLLVSAAIAASPCGDRVWTGPPPLHEVRPSLDGASGAWQSTLPAGLEADLTATLEAARTALQPTAWDVAVVIPGAGAWTAHHGVSEGTPFYAASVGKLVTAALTFHLIDEGRLHLDQSVATWLPDLPNADRTTIRDLLGHTSGLFSFNADRRHHRRGGLLTTDEALDLTRQHPPAACPGTTWAYTNSGYTALAAIAAQVGQAPFADQLTDLLGGDVVVLRQDRPAPFMAAHPSGERFDVRTPGAAGPVASTATGLVSLLQRWLTGGLFDESHVATAFEPLHTMFGDPSLAYGLGVMRYRFPTDDGQLVTWYGHSGGTPFHRALVAWDPEVTAYFAVLAVGDVPVEAVAHKLRQAVARHRP